MKSGKRAKCPLEIYQYQRTMSIKKDWRECVKLYSMKISKNFTDIEKNDTRGGVRRLIYYTVT